MDPHDSTGDEELRQSNPNATGPDGLAGGMGVSSEREGATGGEVGTDGMRETSIAPPADDADTPPEQSAGGEEDNPEGITPKAGYSSVDPRS